MNIVTDYQLKIIEVIIQGLGVLGTFFAVVVALFPRNYKKLKLEFVFSPDNSYLADLIIYNIGNRAVVPKEIQFLVENIPIGKKVYINSQYYYGCSNVEVLLPSSAQKISFSGWELRTEYDHTICCNESNQNKIVEIKLQDIENDIYKIKTNYKFDEFIELAFEKQKLENNLTK